MKQPPQIANVTLYEPHRGPYPPRGFVSFEEANYGNGDEFGLYWPMGREKQDPIICDTAHDAWLIETRFSSLSVFLSWLELNDGEWGEETVPDPGFSNEKVAQAKACLKQNQFEDAIGRLNEAVESFPEACETWTLLASLNFRQGNTEAATHAAIRAYCSNWCFGFPTQQTLNLLKRAAKSTSSDSHLLLARVGQFDLSYGGTKENTNYDVLKQCTDDYLQSDDPLVGLMLHHNYAHMMHGETISFQERYGFDIERWQDEHAQLCERYLGDDRLFDV